MNVTVPGRRHQLEYLYKRIKERGRIVTEQMTRRWYHFAGVMLEETTSSHPHLWWASILGHLLPTGTGGRLRAMLFRACGISVGKGTIFHGPVTFSGHRGQPTRIVIGENCFLNSPLHMDATASIILEDCVSMGHHVLIITADHEIGPPECRTGGLRPAPVTIERGAWIAAGVVLLPGVTVGRGAVVAAGAVVTSDVAPNTLVGGVPARFLRNLPTTTE